jgi:hypothetical protein
VFAGFPGNATLCNSGGLTPLFPLLGGSPTVGGTWTDPDGDPHSGFFLPGTDQPGIYTYHVDGQAPCVDDDAIVSVSVNQLPDAGISNTYTICDNVSPFTLISHLGGTPDFSGDWFDPSLDPHTGIYDPALNDPGVYTYVVEGDAPCPNVSATLTVFENHQPEAGDPNVVSLCSDAQEFMLIDTLLGTPDPKRFVDRSLEPALRRPSMTQAFLSQGSIPIRWTVIRPVRTMWRRSTSSKARRGCRFQQRG